MQATEGVHRGRLRGYVGESLVLAGLVVIAAFFAIQAPESRSLNPTDLGSQFFPRLVASVLIGLVLLRVVILLVTRRPVEEEHPPHWGLLAVMWVAILAYPLLWEVGFIPLTAAFVLVTMLAAGVRSWKTLLLSVVLYTAGSYYVFEELLHVPLP